MRLAFCIFKYFPHGGLQRDFLRILHACKAHGHAVDIYTTEWQGPEPKNTLLHLLPTRGRTNHGHMTYFAKRLRETLSQTNYDAVIGFNKLPGLDFYFAGDVCLRARLNEKPFFYRWLPRYQCYLALEKAVFTPSAKTHIFVLTEAQKDQYRACYHTAADRFHILPPGIARNPYTPTEMQQIRTETRQALGIAEDTCLLLFVATKFYNKGLDRAAKAVQKLSNENIHLFVIGNDDPKPYQRMTNITFTGAQDDITNMLLAADILIHPARVEAAGMILVEAIAMGLPVITTDICGYAYHVTKANSGLVVTPSQVDMGLQKMMNAHQRKCWHDNALKYAAITDLYDMAEKAVGIIEGKHTCL
jgi:UDP-glucose:(heptosyl)LPS alpha-1,3-glucosyltransferase